MVDIRWKSFRLWIFFVILSLSIINADETGNLQSDETKTISPSLFPPVLKVKSTEGYLPELSEIGTTVRISPSLHADSLQILVEDADLKPGMPPAIYQYVLTGFGAEKFAVDQRGYLYLNDPDIDADTNSSTYQLHVQAREVDTEPIRSSEPISITIHIIDVNDNAPIFEAPMFTTNVTANDPQERTVLKVKATDLDAGKFGKITYRIGKVTGAPYQAFRYDDYTNELKAIGPLNPGEQYQVLLEAMDGGGLMGKTVILINAMDDFDPYSAANLGASLGAAAGAAAVTAGQSVVSPQPITGAVVPPFPQTVLPQPISSVLTENSITAAPLLPIVPFTAAGIRRTTFEETTEPVQTLVTEINEATPPRAVVAILGDEDTRQKVYFIIAAGNEEGKFAIEEETGKITTTAEFDREQTDMYTLQIEARSKFPDQALYWTILQVAVTDANDNPPKFVDPQPIHLHLSIDDFNDFGPNMKVGKINVRDIDADDNGRVTLRIVPPMNRLFIIDADGNVMINGQFTTAHFGTHKVTILATDHGDPALESRIVATVTIDGTYITQATANPNEVTSYSGEEQTDNEISSTLFTRATLPPMHTIQPEINAVSSFPHPIPTTNWVPQTRTSMSSLKSTATAYTKQPLPTVPFPLPSQPIPQPRPSPPAHRIAPVFTTPVLSVMVEENESELELATVEARYPDGQPGTITYVMQAGDPSLFAISSFTGTLTLLKPLDAEGEQEYVVKIGTAESAGLSTDETLPHSATITIKVIDVNDWIPNFETNNYAFAVNANTEPGTIIGQVAAFDQDRDEPNNKIHFRLVNTDGMEKYFAVNSENGLITLNRNVKEFVGEKITLRVEASDEGEPSQSTQADVVIDIEPSESEVIPKSASTSFSSNPENGAIQFSLRNYTASISEAVRPPHLVQVLTVLNKPSDTRFMMCNIISGNYRGAFTISPGSDGNCELRTQMQLDRETVERYLLNVTVTSGEQTDFALISITVLDANDNAPRFIFSNGLDLSIYFAGVSSTSGPFTRILTVKAEDADLGNSSLIQYELDPFSVDSKFFTIDKNNGEISTRQSMETIISRNRKNFFEMKVIATDSPISGQTLSAKADVVINVVSEQHRFSTIIKGIQPQQLRSHEDDMIKAIRQFTGLCTLITMERLDEIIDVSNSLPTVRAIWYAVNPSTKKICKKQEFRKLFENPTLDLIAGKVKPWFTLEKIQENSGTSSSLGNNGYDGEFEMTNNWWPNNLGIPFIVLLFIGLAIGVILIIGICAIYYWATNYSHRHSTIHNVYPPVHQMPKYGPFYLQSDTIERNKIYETQMLELPISDEDFTMKNSSLRSSANGVGRPQPQRRLNQLRDEQYGRERDDTPQSVNVPHHTRQPTTSRQYGRQHSVHDEGDFSIEESMYAINTPGRLDPVTKYLY
uniref:Cadherin domain-containing protein n=1 Tax=Panagrolaimus sp. JU765 TaxID=591449 RepID=A0AC34RR14_9BILA